MSRHPHVPTKRSFEEAEAAVRQTEIPKMLRVLDPLRFPPRSEPTSNRRSVTPGEESDSSPDGKIKDISRGNLAKIAINDKSVFNRDSGVYELSAPISSGKVTVDFKFKMRVFRTPFITTRVSSR